MQIVGNTMTAILQLLQQSIDNHYCDPRGQCTFIQH